MASRILGMGDVVTLVEKAQEEFDQDEAEKMQKKMEKGSFGFDDFLKQMQTVRKMGGLGSMMKLMPGMGQLGDMEVDDKEIKRIEGIVHSMTLAERKNPDIISSSRRRRIAAGAGQDVQQVASLVKTFNKTRDMMKAVSGGGFGGLKGLMSGNTDLMGMMNSGKKIKQRSKRKKPDRKKKKRR